MPAFKPLTPAEIENIIKELKSLHDEDADVQNGYFLALEKLKFLLGQNSLNEKRKPTLAEDFLQDGIRILHERGQGYDGESERSMEKIVKIFNEVFDKDITERQGWEFMVILKLVRSASKKVKEDTFIDKQNYSALAAEAFTRETK